MTAGPENKNRAIYDNKYAISDNSKEYLTGLGFRQRNEDGMYTYHFDALRHERTTVLIGRRIIVYDDSKDIHIDILDNNGLSYAPFYNAAMYNTHRVVLEKVDSAVLKEFKKLGIKKVISNEKRNKRSPDLGKTKFND